MRRRHGKGDPISAVRHQRNSMEVTKFEKGLENKVNFIRQRLEMGIPLKESSISKVGRGKFLNIYSKT